MTVFHTPMITLSDGNLIPQIGLGVLRIDDEGVTPVVESALEAGYRHIDGAAGYNNEAGVGRALQNAGFTQGENRKNLWVTTKLRDSEQGYDSARKAFDRQLEPAAARLCGHVYAALADPVRLAFRRNVEGVRRVPRGGSRAYAWRVQFPAGAS